MSILMNSISFMFEQIFFLKITKNPMDLRCFIFSLGLYSVSLFVVIQFVSVQWVSFLLQFILPILFLNILSKENHIMESLFTNVLDILFSCLNSLVFWGLNIESRIASCMLIVGGYGLFYLICRQNQFNIPKKLRCIISVVLFIFSFTFLWIVKNLLSMEEYTYAYFIKNSQIFIFLFILFFLIFLCIFILFLTQVQTKVELEVYDQFVNVSSQYTTQMVREQTKIKKLVHDMRNTLDDIQYLSKQNRFKEAEDKIDSSLEEYGMCYSTSICTNPYVDFMLQNFICVHALEYDIQILIPERIPMCSKDITTLLSCVLADELIQENELFMFHMQFKEKELVLHIKYSLSVSGMNSIRKSMLDILIQNYKGLKYVDDKDMKIILYIE